MDDEERKVRKKGEIECYLWEVFFLTGRQLPRYSFMEDINFGFTTVDSFFFPFSTRPDIFNRLAGPHLSRP